LSGRDIDMGVSEGISGRSVGLIVVCRIAEWWAENAVKIGINWIKGKWSKLWGRRLKGFNRKGTKITIE